MSILKLLDKKLKRTLFTTPTHSQKNIGPKWLEGLYEHDFSEIEGFDNLQNPTGAIMLAQERLSSIYGTKKTFMLTNGSTSGILAIIKAILKPNDKVLIARNCHKSVFSAITLTNAKIDWIIPNINEEWGIYTEIDPKNLENNLKLDTYKAVILTSPTYEGVNSNIEEIAKICHQYGVYLMVDEAHGALYNFSDLLPKTAIEQGADFSVNSLHKNAGAPNSCALLHVSKNCNFDEDKIQDSLNLFATTSPSYPMLASIEACVDFLNKNGKEKIKKLIINIENFEKSVSQKGYEFLNADKTKILLKKNNCDMLVLSQILFEGFNIEDEMASNKALLFLTGIGTTNSKLNKLKDALNFIKIPQNVNIKNDFQPFPFIKIQPYDAFNMDYVEIDSKEALLKVSAQMITKTPPCCAILYPGEVIQEWHLDKIGERIKVLKHE
ncbi:MAG: aminotransferase class V-fold PLP-dependent enzyme [Cyanobacteria bacterium SIG30]|nr:aminotransferase class V-fold PLP-dependent enzyme [Cyanobacteria bacterium SIG30]